MRRPVKPFVTEYKATNRRPGGRGGNDDFFGAPAANDGASRGGGDNGSRPENARVDARAENAYEAALKAADALFAPAPKGSGAAANEPGSQGNVTQMEMGEAPASGRRILRAIDESQVPGLDVAEEAEPPKRRGRKPGSKNKPKPVVAAPPIDPVPEPDDEDFDDEEQLEVTSAPASTRRTVPYRPRNVDRFAWVRTKLKPGEQWKRRLPKVCW